MADYYTLLTNAGIAYENACKAAGVPIKLSQISVGDGGGAVYNPAATATALKREVWRGPLNALFQDDKNPSWLLAEVTIPPEVGGWYVREAGIWTDTGILYAVVKYPESFKPVLATSGSGKEFYIRSIFETSNASEVTLLIDDNIVKATRAWVAGYVADELAKLDGKRSVRAASLGNIVLSGLQQVDGVAVLAGDRVLVAKQTAGKDNGLYVVAAGAWARATDADNSLEVTPGLFVSVEEGAVNGDSVWQLVTDAPIVLGTTALTFEVVAGRTGLAAGTYRSVTVDKLGRVIAGTNFTTLAGAGITDAVSSNNDVAIVGKVSDVGSARFINGNPDTTDLPAGISYFSGIRAKYNGGKLGFDFGCSMTGRRSFGRLTLANGTGDWFEYWTSANFDPSSKMPVAGGNYKPRLAGVAFDSDVSDFGVLGGYIGWGASGSGAMQFVCNKGGGAGGFSWRSVNADNSQTGPELTYSYSGLLTAPSLYVSGSSFVPTAADGDSSGSIASTNFVARAFTRLLVVATEAVKGIVRFATQSEVNAGVSDDSVVTPKKMRAGFSISLGAAGWVAFPTWLGGIIFQWSLVQETTGTSGFNLFPMAFPTAVLSMVATSNFAHNNSTWLIVPDRTKYLIGLGGDYNSGGASSTLYWLAIGY